MTVSDDVTITVNPAPPNTAPGGERGAPTQPSPYPRRLTLKDRDRRRPAVSAGTVSKSWTKVSGPGTVTFSSPNALNTSATFSVAGTYVLRLTASDSVLSARTRDRDGECGSGERADRAVLQDPGNGAHFATLVLTRVDPTVNFTGERHRRLPA